MRLSRCRPVQLRTEVGLGPLQERLPDVLRSVEAPKPSCCVDSSEFTVVEATRARVRVFPICHATVSHGEPRDPPNQAAGLRPPVVIWFTR